MEVRQLVQLSSLYSFAPFLSFRNLIGRHVLTLNPNSILGKAIPPKYDGVFDWFSLIRSVEI